MSIFKKKLNFPKKIKIGFIYPETGSYFNAMASTRLHCFDIIHYFKNDKNYLLEKYSSSTNYNIVIFQKSFDGQYFKKAIELKNRGAKIILDINVNYIDISENGQIGASLKQRKDILNMISICDIILVSSDYLRELYSNFCKYVVKIEENVHNDFFNYKKHHCNTDRIKLVYCGYSEKAKEILFIKDVILKIQEKENIELIIISEKDPQIKFIPYEYIEYNQKKLGKQLIQGDIKIAPRNLKNKYNLGHSFTKVAYPMAVGIPVVASPLPSYLNRNVFICENQREWEDKLLNLIKSSDLRNYYGNIGIDFIKNNFTIKIIGENYRKIFELIKVL